MFIVDAIRTPYGQRGGALSLWHPVDLAAESLKRLLRRCETEGSAVDAVILGCTSQVGAQACNIARRAVLAAGWPEDVPGATIDSHAASSAQAVHWAAQAVMSGAHGLVVAGGVELMTAVPLGAALAQPEIGKPCGRGLLERYGSGAGFLPPGLAAEEVARRWSFGRAELDAWAVQSRERALVAQSDPPSFILPVATAFPAAVAIEPSVRARPPVPTKVPHPYADRPGLLVRDERLDRPWSARQVSALPAAYVEGGVTTAGNLAGEADGASAVLVASPERARVLAVKPKARFVSLATAGVAPAIWPVATIPATQQALSMAGLLPGDIDQWYVYESSAAAALAWMGSIGADEARVNRDGGALASGAPLGAVGGGIFAAAVSRLVDSAETRAVVAVAGEGGVATACVIEAV